MSVLIVAFLYFVAFAIWLLAFVWAVNIGKAMEKMDNKKVVFNSRVSFFAHVLSALLLIYATWVAALCNMGGSTMSDAINRVSQIEAGHRAYFRWQRGDSTAQIAKLLNWPEHEVVRLVHDQRQKRDGFVLPEYEPSSA